MIPTLSELPAAAFGVRAISRAQPHRNPVFGATARYVALALLSLVGTGLHAQVLRCTDVRTGKVTYTDSNCSVGQRTAEVEPQKTPQEIQAERTRAEDALEAKEKRQSAQALVEERQREREVREDEQQRRGRAQNTANQDYGSSRSCTDARTNLASATANLARTPEEQATRIDAAQQQMDFACLGPDAYARAQASRANREPGIVVVQPPIFTNRPRPGWQGRPDRPLSSDRPHIQECTSFTCTDTNGKRYPRTGRGSFQER